MEYALNVLTGTAIMFILIIIGYFLYRSGILNDDGRNQLSKIMLRLVCPVLIFMAYQTDYNPELLSGIIWSFVLSVLSVIIAILVSKILISKKSNDRVIEQFSIIYTNCGFMGIPLVQGVFGNEGVLYVTTYLAVFNLAVWSHGVMMMKGEMSLSGFFKSIKSPTIISVILGITFYLTGIRLPKVPADALNYIAGLNTPIAMIIAGATIASSNIIKIIKNASILKITFIKLLVLPVIVMLLLRLLPVPSPMVFSTIMIATGCPTATIGTMFALEYKKNAVYAAEIFAVTTLLSVVSLPIVVMLSQFVYNFSF